MILSLIELKKYLNSKIKILILIYYIKDIEMAINQKHPIIYVIIKEILLFLLKLQKIEKLEDFAQLDIKYKEDFKKMTLLLFFL